MTEPPESAGGVPDLDLTSERDGADPFADDSPDGDPDSTGGSPDDGSTDESEPDVTGDSDPGVTDVSPPDETDDDEVEPVELLVQLAEEGEIEPWDIDIVQVTDAFLEKLDETDLRTTGRALFYASVLLRMKSDGMLADDDEDEEPEPEPWEVAMEGGAPDPADGDFDPIDELEAEMDRRLDRKNTRGSPETLDELVRELREAERGSWGKDSRVRHLRVAARPRPRHADARLSRGRRVPTGRGADRRRGDRPHPRRGHRGGDRGDRQRPPDPLRPRAHGGAVR